jgi:iron complex outermembrane receptor protein
MIRAPKWTAAASVNYTIPVAAGELELSANYFHSDGFYWEPSNRTRQDPYDVINAQIAYSPDGSRWRIRVFGRNLGDETYYNSLAEQAIGDAATAFPPRTYGVGFDYKLGAH